MPPQPRRTSQRTYYGIKIIDVDKFLTAIIAVVIAIGTITYWGTKFYLQQDFNEKQHQAERDCDNKISTLETKVQVLESTKDILTKSDLDLFQANQQKSKGNDKK